MQSLDVLGCFESAVHSVAEQQWQRWRVWQKYIHIAGNKSSQRGWKNPVRINRKLCFVFNVLMFIPKYWLNTHEVVSVLMCIFPVSLYWLWYYKTSTQIKVWAIDYIYIVRLKGGFAINLALSYKTHIYNFNWNKNSRWLINSLMLTTFLLSVEIPLAGFHATLFKNWHCQGGVWQTEAEWRQIRCQVSAIRALVERDCCHAKGKK